MPQVAPLPTRPEAGAATDEEPRTPQAPAARRGREGRVRAFVSRHRYKLISLASVICALCLWQVFAEVGWINRTLSSSPFDVWDSFKDVIKDGTLKTALLSSVQLYALGLLCSIVIGIVFGIALGWWRAVGAVFDPWIAVLYSTPMIALLPLILVWFGIGFQGRLVMVILVSVFPLLVSVMTGSRQVDDALLRLAKSFRASQWAIMRTLLLPSLVPYIVTGVRLAVGTALIGVVLAEYFEGTDGIGGMILRAGVELNSGKVFVGIAILAATALTLTGLIRMLEARFSSWRDA
jgi:NitT/TauT family transport system permease protein